MFHERGALTSSFTEKSDTIARMYIDHGTFGFVPGAPSAYTQPLYAWFLIPIYWAAGAKWWSVAPVQIAAALVTAWLVFEIGRRFLSTRGATIAAVISTVNPYLVWHDVHINREIVDQLLAAAVVLLTLLVVEKPNAFRSTLLGLTAGVSMLGNTRLVFLPVLCALYVVWRLPRRRIAPVSAVVILAGSAIAVFPWLVRNEASVGCFTLTTDGRAMWKGKHPRHHQIFRSWQWIDNIS